MTDPKNDKPVNLIDTHLHLIARDRFGYGWADGIPALADGNFTLEDAISLSSPRVQNWIFMEAAVDDEFYRDEARWVHGLMAREPRLAGQIASCRPETDDGFTAWLDECDGLGVVGFRRVLHVVDDEMSQSDTFRANIRRIGMSGKAFDMCFLARQLPIARELARACPDTQLVLDHCGVPDIAGGGLDPWREDISALAELPNVTCKFSGIMAYCAPGTANIKTLRPYVDHVLEAFGPKRMLWGGDWPVVNLAEGLPAWLDVTSEILAQLSDHEAAEIGQRTAQRVYGL